MNINLDVYVLQFRKCSIPGLHCQEVAITTCKTSMIVKCNARMVR